LEKSEPRDLGEKKRCKASYLGRVVNDIRVEEGLRRDGIDHIRLCDVEKLKRRVLGDGRRRRRRRWRQRRKRW
jgi:hypothetical protein